MMMKRGFVLSGRVIAGRGDFDVDNEPNRVI